MPCEPHATSFLPLFALLNPLLMSIWLIDLITDLGTPAFVAVPVRGATISGIVFLLFARGGGAIFSP